MRDPKIIPVNLPNSHFPVGTIKLNPELELLFEKGTMFVASAVLKADPLKGLVLIGVNFLPIEVEKPNGN